MNILAAAQYCLGVRTSHVSVFKYRVVKVIALLSNIRSSILLGLAVSHSLITTSLSKEENELAKQLRVCAIYFISTVVLFPV